MNSISKAQNQIKIENSLRVYTLKQTPYSIIHNKTFNAKENIMTIPKSITLSIEEENESVKLHSQQTCRSAI